jgi:hypothetical protein
MQRMPQSLRKQKIKSKSRLKLPTVKRLSKSLNRRRKKLKSRLLNQSQPRKRIIRSAKAASDLSNQLMNITLL